MLLCSSMTATPSPPKSSQQVAALVLELLWLALVPPAAGAWQAPGRWVFQEALVQLRPEPRRQTQWSMVQILFPVLALTRLQRCRHQPPALMLLLHRLAHLQQQARESVKVMSRMMLQLQQPF